ncbi:carbamoyltransferase HypF [Shewanella litorisediminis]|uniref:Carbamoyltransferase HypF n=1 Tax=Shewanella litorisediminis TaxID=1173586 RepID=A0ABX7G7Z4_9GAMM|nr:carbamoyltransferase HypF [Shewanella litorisediminis]MCL2919126.1 carbamoyltransferase HypF [Shewanella litorisediminis]QRH03376.1 carbamoyltransferase HypF [Shewanella litorisediminis]
MSTKISLHITGIVQGVGFRPHVFRLAHELGLGGSIRNDAEGVFIRLVGAQYKVDEFIEKLRSAPPPLARIDGFTLIADDGPDLDETRFVIEESQAGGEAQVVVSPDKSMCPDCLADIRNPKDRHYRYPFTNCTNCGPRYTLIKALPYDRKHTSMAHFAMCAECEAEYKNPLDRRYHAQPVSCPNCGPTLSLTGPDGRLISSAPDFCLDECARLLKQGAIFAIKGLGGFHLVCDATSEEAVSALRARKVRPAKPLAVMVKDPAMAKSFADGADEEWQLLCSRERPIVIMKKAAAAIGSPLNVVQQSELAPSVAPGIDRIGLFLPYTPLHALLLDAVDRPLVATSANRSGEPIIIDAADIHQKLAGVVDYILDHDRPIVSGCDDSVVQWCAGQLQVIRLARGYAPLAILSPRPSQSHLMAVGPQQKNTLAFGLGHNLFLSPHIGDLFSIEAEDYFIRTLESFKRLYQVEPGCVVADHHPDYAPSRFARRYAQSSDRGVELLTVQHHFAHILSVMAANSLSEPVLGFSFDGTGLGDDMSLWGGEVLLCSATHFERLGGLKPFALPGGDKASSEPWRVLLSLLSGYLSASRLQGLPCLAHLSPSMLSNHLKVISRPGTLQSSSMGRLFDAAAALLGICQRVEFEGQAGMLLEAFAARATGPIPTLILEEKHGQWDGAALLVSMLEQMDTLDTPPECLAKAFINAIADAIVEKARHYPNLPVALSGGVFQSRTLANATALKLSQQGLKLLPWGQVPVNDGGIALGQLWYAVHSFNQ